MVWRCPSVRPSVRPHVASSNPCGQDIARTMWPRMLNLSVYTLHCQISRSNFKVTGP